MAQYKLKNIPPNIQSEFKVGETAIAVAITVPGLTILTAIIGYEIEGSDRFTRTLTVAQAQDNKIDSSERLD